MGAHSTINVKRSAAQRFLAEQADSLDDETLARLIDVILDKRLYNCTIVGEDDQGEDDLSWAL